MKLISTTLTFLILTFVSFSQKTNYRTDEVIVRLNFKLLDWDVVDDPTIKTSSIKDLLSEEGQSYIATLPEKSFLIENLSATKIFSFLKTSDSISIGRQGQEVYIPPFWATFKVEVPNGMKLEQFGNDLKDLYPIVIYAHPNFNVETTSAPNDSFYVNQESINPFGALDHIMMDTAWSIETGEPWIKVGIFDTGIDSTHEDIELLTGKTYDGEFLDSWGTSIPNDHGTKVAGIIGARRNNGIGIAGIAGGNGSDTSGVSLIDFKRYNTNGEVVSIDLVSAGIIDASRHVGSYYDWSAFGASSYYYNNAPGYGIHVGNHSYGYRIGDDTKNEDDSLSNGGVTLPGGFYTECDLCRESFLFSLQNGVVNVVSRGNKLLQPGLVNPYSYQEPDRVFPASYDDSWVISVSASATDGNRLVGGVNGSDGYFPLIGRGVDVVAPGSKDFVYTTHSPQGSYSNDYYGTFAGTSAAAPHVAGVAALLLSYYNKNCYSNTNLDPADVEKIIEKSATATQENLDSNGYNVLSGHGRLNAFEALKLIELPKYQIIHPDTLPFSQQIIEVDTISMWLQSPLSITYNGPLGSTFPLDNNEYYRVVMYKYQLEYNFGEYVSSNTQLLDTWVRHSQTNSLGIHYDTITGITGYTYPGGIPTPIISLIVDTFRVEPMCVIDTVTNDSIIRLTGYYYNFIGIYDLGLSAPYIPMSQWYPIDPNLEQPKMAFSVYIFDDSLTSQYDFPCYAANELIDSFASVDMLNKRQIIELYPNPGNDQLVIGLSENATGGYILVTDAYGRKIKEVELIGNEPYIIDTSHMRRGIYFVSLINNGVIETSKKWMKQ